MHGLEVLQLLLMLYLDGVELPLQHQTLRLLFRIFSFQGDNSTKTIFDGFQLIGFLLGAIGQGMFIMSKTQNSVSKTSNNASSCVGTGYVPSRSYVIRGAFPSSASAAQGATSDHQATLS
jgi:hypothetical protein